MGGHFVYVTWTFTPSNTFAALFFTKLLCLLAYQLKDCKNGQDKEKEETPMSGSRNGLLQSCWDRVTIANGTQNLSNQSNWPFWAAETTK